MGRRYFPFEMTPSKRGTFVGFRGRKKWSISVDVLDGGPSLTHATSWSSWQEVSSIPSFVGFFPHPILKKICASQMFITLPKDPGWKFPKNLWKFRHLDSDLEVFQIDLTTSWGFQKKLLNLTPRKNHHTTVSIHTSLRYWWQNWAWRVDGRVGCHRGCWSS